MLMELVRQLDDFVLAKDIEARSAGMRRWRPSVIRLLGQHALFEWNVPLTLAATNDVDVYADYEYGVEQEFRRCSRAVAWSSTRWE